MKTGHKHLIKCRCFLPQFREMSTPPQHNFVVFSVIEDDEIVPKLVQCNNCGVIHNVIDFCKSNIVSGKEHSNAILTIDDIKMGIPSQNLVTLLERSDVDLATWEAAKFIIDNERWGEYVVLSAENAGDGKQRRYVRILGKTLFSVDTTTSNDVLS
jgi:hypothetical protein